MNGTPEDTTVEKELFGLVAEALRSTIEAHGDISTHSITSVQKRLVPLILDYLQRTGLQRAENAAFLYKIDRLRRERNDWEKRCKRQHAAHNELAKRLGLIKEKEAS